MTLCPPCQAKHDGWLDYPLPPTLKIASGAARDDTPAGVADARRARYESWRNLIQEQQTLIESICEEKHSDTRRP